MTLIVHLQPKKEPTKVLDPPEEDQPTTSVAATALPAVVEAPAATTTAAAAEIGASSELPQRNPMSLLKQPAPLLSIEAYEAVILPMDDLRDAAGRAENCVWNRVCLAHFRFRVFTIVPAFLFRKTTHHFRS